MAFGLPNISFVGYPVSIPCAGHSGLGFREGRRRDGAAMVAHFGALDPVDLRMRFCASVNESGLIRHVDGLWNRDGFVLAAFDGPLWPGPFHRAGPIRALAELAVAGKDAELGLSVHGSLRRRGVGTYMVQTAARLLAPRGVRRIVAYTLPGNHSFLALSRSAGAEIASGPDEVEITFDVEALTRDYLRRRLHDQVFRKVPGAGPTALLLQSA